MSIFTQAVKPAAPKPLSTALFGNPAKPAATPKPVVAPVAATKPTATVATPSMVGKPTAASSAPQATPTSYWNQDVATALGQIFNYLPSGGVATGGALDKAVAADTDKARQAEYKRLAIGLQQGTITPEQAQEALVERYIATQQAKTPDFGQLAKPAYQDYSPYGGVVPEFKPFSLEDFKESPDYQFRLEQGQKAIDRAGAARGKFYSGGALKEAARFGSDLASGEYNNAYNRYNQDFATKYGLYTDADTRYNQRFGIGYGQAKDNADTLFNRLYGMAGAGQGAVNTGVNLNSNNANLLSSIYSGMGNNAAAAGIAKGNALTGAAGQIAGGLLYDRLYGKG